MLKTHMTDRPVCPHCDRVDNKVVDYEVATFLEWQESGHRSVCVECCRPYDVMARVFVFFSTFRVPERSSDSVVFGGD